MSVLDQLHIPRNWFGARTPKRSRARPRAPGDRPTTRDSRRDGPELVNIVTGLMLAAWVALAYRFERDNGRPAGAADVDADRKPETVRDRTWKDVIVQVYFEQDNDRLLAVAAGVVFYGLLALFPAVTALVSSYGLFADIGTISKHLQVAADVMPPSAFNIVQEQVTRIVANGSASLSFGFAIGLGVAIWSANAGMKAMMDALNVIYDVRETRSFIRLNLASLTLTLGALVFLLLAIGAVVVFPLVMAAFGLNTWTETVIGLARWPLLLLGLITAIAVLYKFGPNVPDARWRWISPGSVFAALAWLAGSALLSLYLSSFADYNKTYGSLGAGIGLMMWLWLSASVVLLGAEINSVLDRGAKSGQRPAVVPAQGSSGMGPTRT